MIFVDDLVRYGAPWSGGVSCHLISDESELELRAFAQGMGLPMHWFQNRSLPHFDLSPSWRARALKIGATPVDRRGFVEAVRRFRARHPERYPAPASRP